MHEITIVLVASSVRYWWRELNTNYCRRVWAKRRWQYICWSSVLWRVLQMFSNKWKVLDCCHGSAFCASSRQCCRSLHVNSGVLTVMMSLRWPGVLCGMSQVSQRGSIFCIHALTHSRTHSFTKLLTLSLGPSLTLWLFHSFTDILSNTLTGEIERECGTDNAENHSCLYRLIAWNSFRRWTHPSPANPRSWELRMQKLKSHLVRTQSLNVLPFKPGVGQYIAIYATLTAREFFLAYFYPSSPFTCIFSKTSPNFFLCWPAE